jgi:hypothetical protein
VEKLAGSDDAEYELNVELIAKKRIPHILFIQKYCTIINSYLPKAVL